MLILKNVLDNFHYQMPIYLVVTAIDIFILKTNKELVPHFFK